MLNMDHAWLAEQNIPDWTVPAAMQRDSAPVVYERPVSSSNGIQSSAVYVFADDEWHWLGMRSIVTKHKAAERETNGQVHYLGKGRYSGLSLDELRSNRESIRSGESLCTDTPDMMFSELPINAEVGDTLTYEWTNSAQQCEYSATYRYSTPPGATGGVPTWYTIAFEYTFTGDVIGPPADDDTE